MNKMTLWCDLIIGFNSTSRKNTNSAVSYFEIAHFRRLLVTNLWGEKFIFVITSCGSNQRLHFKKAEAALGKKEAIFHFDSTLFLRHWLHI